MLLTPRERKQVVDLLEEQASFYVKPLLPLQYRTHPKKKKVSKKTKAAATAPKATGPKAKAPKKAAKKAFKTATVVKAPTITGGSTAGLPLSKRLSMARAAVTGMTRQESATANKLAEKGVTTHKWQYLADNGKFLDYSPGASVEVEKAFATWQVNPHVDVRAVKSGQWEYMVDFNLMQQQNIKHDAHKIRKVQRVTL